MIRTIVVDDEKVIRDGIGRFIKETEGFELLDVCEDGIEAYEKITDKKPDVVISDIIMPHMDGIELIGKCRENGIKSEFILLSGYSEFEYARAAIRYGVLEYLNKPVNPGELRALLENTKRIIETRKHMKKRFQSSIYEKALESDEPIMEATQGYRMHRVIVINASGNEIGKKRKHQIQITVNDCENLLSREAYEEYIVYEKRGLVVLIVIGMDAKEHQIEKMCEEIRKQALTRGWNIFIGVGSMVEQLQEISFSYKTAKAALYETVCSKKPQCFFEHLPYSYQSSTRIYAIDFSGICNAIHLKEKDMIQKEVPRLARVYQISSPPYVIYSFVIACAKEMLALREENKIKYEDLEDLVLARDVEELLARFHDFTENFYENADYSMETRYGGIIDDVLGYIQLHYMEDISIEKICKVFYFNQNYFSVLFKGKTGVNYNDYVTELRIGKARELLKAGRYKISEIAELVGYNSSRYFSKVFKARMGVLPKEYRNNHLEN